METGDLPFEAGGGKFYGLKNAVVQRQDVSESGLRRALIVAAVMAATLMQTLDSTITNVALPNIQGNLGASQDEGTWIVTA